MALKNGALLLTLPLALLACGQVAHVNRQNTAAAISSPQSQTPAPSPCVEGPLPPNGQRLSAPRDYSSHQIQLAVVEASVQPLVSAAQAFAQLGYQSTTNSCGLTEELAYWSSDTPATIASGCSGPDLSQMPEYCKTAPAKPFYQQVLAWVFTWHTDCGGPGGSGGASVPGQPRGQPQPVFPRACTAISFVDATTGTRSGYTTDST